MQWSETMPKYLHIFFLYHFKSGIKKMENQKGNTKIQNPTTHKDTELIQKVLIPSSSFPRAPYFICVGFYDSLHITQNLYSYWMQSEYLTAA